VAEWRHGLVVVLPGSLVDALTSVTRCGEEEEPYRRLCLEEAVVDMLAMLVEERNPGWRMDGLRQQALLELAARYLSWLRAGGYDEETGWELLRRAYNSAAAALYAAPRRLKNSRLLRRGLETARRALEEGRGLEDAVEALDEAVGAACARCPDARRGARLPLLAALRGAGASGPVASALPP